MCFSTFYHSFLPLIRTFNIIGNKSHLWSISILIRSLNTRVFLFSVPFFFLHAYHVLYLKSYYFSVFNYMMGCKGLYLFNSTILGLKSNSVIS